MKIIISDIPVEGMDILIEESIKSDILHLIEAVSGKFKIERSGTEVIIKGNIHGTIQQTCSRCLNEFKKEIDLDIFTTFHPVTELREEIYELHGEELEVDFYTGEEIDIDSLIEEEILLSLPMKPLCNEDCKGLCPVCGKDLNYDKCDCPQQNIDERFLKLKNLLLKER